MAPLPVAAALACACLPSVHAQSALPETVVSATRFADDASTLPAGVSVITAEEIRRAGASTVNDAIRRVLGVPGRMDFYGGGEYGLDLRGFGSTADTNQVVILDGVRLSENDLGGTRLAGIPIDAVERIEVLRGSGAVLYGEGATAGVIVITTKAAAGRQRATGGSLTTTVGSDGLRQARVEGTVQAGGLSVDVAGQRRDDDNRWRENFASRLDAASVGVQWAGDRLRLGVRHAQDDLTTGLPGSLSAAQYAADRRQAATPQDNGSVDNALTTAFVRYDAGPWELGWDVSRRSKELRSTAFFGGTPSVYAYDIDASTSALRARHRLQSGGWGNDLRLGVDLGHWRRNVLGAFGTVADQSTRGIYLRDELKLPSGTRLSAGVRQERLRKGYDDGFAPLRADADLRAWELGAVQPLGAGWSAYARTGRSFRVANVDEYTFAVPATGLQPQTSRDHELGARWADAASRAELRYYRSELRNEIGFDPGIANPFAFSGFGANVNFDPTRRQGLEFEGSHRYSATLAVRAVAALRSATFEQGVYAGRDVPLAARRTLALRADWTVAPQHRLSGGVQYVDEQSVTFANSCKVPAHTTADLRYAYDWQKAEFSIGVSNLFDRRYYTAAFRCAADGRTTAIYPEAGRIVTAALRLRF